MTDAQRIEQLGAQVASLIATNATLAGVIAESARRSTPVIFKDGVEPSLAGAWASGRCSGAPIPPHYMTTSGQIVRGEIASP